ncbi:hypothetical protein KBY88_14525 [Cyanobium sp. Morenito 9A2]|nr:hypothetical protein [Cyanobium sp. Morenito 9A2]
MKRILLLVVVAAGSFQGGRLTERAIGPCRMRPLAALVAPLFGQKMPSPQLCELMLKLPSP